MPEPLYDPESDDEVRQLRALDAMAAVEFMLSSLPLGAEVPAGQVLALVTLANDAVRDLLLWEPRRPANDNG
jgi:hypothetical protein